MAQAIRKDKKQTDTQRINQLEHLVRRMANMLHDYGMPDIDYQAKDLLDEAKEIALN